MLVLSRKIGEKIVISNDIVVTVLNVDGEQIKLGIDAPRNISVHRQEVYEDILRSNREAMLASKRRNDVLLGVSAGRQRNRRT